MPQIERESFMQKVLKEFELGKSLKHKNIGNTFAYIIRDNNFIVKNYHYHMEGDDLYIFLEYAGGGTLKSKIHKLREDLKTMDENQVRIYTKQILEALEYLHCIKGIFHRDIKPENILLTLSENIKISDFGESKFVNVSGGTFVGTPAYIAPEIISVKIYISYNICDFTFFVYYFYVHIILNKKNKNSEQKYNFSVDIWSLGCMVYEMLTGELLMRIKAIDLQM